MDLKDYKLVFEDDFNGSELDLEKWEFRKIGARGIGFNAPSQVRVENGKLILTCSYLKDGEFGPGWYAASLRAKQRFLRGYFEIRCIANDPIDTRFVSAFWLQSKNSYLPELSRGGLGGAEIDINEAFRTREGEPSACSTIHAAGYADGRPARKLRSMPSCRTIIPDCYTAYHVYGCEWTDEIYRFFVDGECVCETSWADGVSQVEEQLIVSLEFPGAPAEDESKIGEYIVDYIRVYQREE